MRITKASILVLISALFFITSCDKDEMLTSDQEQVHFDTVEYVAKNFYKEHNKETVDEILNLYQSFDYEQMKKFIDLRYQYNMQEQAPLESTQQIQKLMHSINDKVFEKTGKSYASADQDLVLTIYNDLDQQASLTGTSEKNRRCPNGNWFRTKNTRWQRNAPGWWVPVDYIGRFNFQGNSNDCDYVFRTRNYNHNFYRAVRISANSAAAASALGFRGARTIPSTEPAINRYDARLEFLVGKGRVDINYLGFNAPNNFARDVDVIIERK